MSNLYPTTVVEPAGLGDMQVVPTGTANGIPIGAAPVGAIGVRMYLGSSDIINFTIAKVQPTSAPVATFTISGSTQSSWDEPLTGGEMIYIISTTAGARFRFI